MLRATQAISAYQNVDGGQSPTPKSRGGSDLASLLSRSLGSAVQTGQQAETQAASAVSGGNTDLIQVVTAVSRAELALQTTTVVRDRVLQAYQDIIKMPI